MTPTSFFFLLSFIVAALLVSIQETDGMKKIVLGYLLASAIGALVGALLVLEGVV